MIRKEKMGISWLEFEIFQGLPLQHAYFLRHGGISSPPYGFNFSLFQGDNSANVKAHLSLVKDIISSKEIARSSLIHENTVEIVNRATEEDELTADGLVTKKVGLTLLTTFADCQCTLLYDPKKHVIANLHAGWRGNVSNIYGAAVTKLQEAYGCEPTDILAGVGPSLGPQHAQFINYSSELPESFMKFRCGDCHFDLWGVARNQLEEAGLLPEHIEVAGICTYAEKDDFFSYRREKLCGRHAGVITLRNRGNIF